ncbi:hypothetical protein [Ruficoccus sp. ZRK36]|uniref:hypothetical protein n=1 Tax=Ruficoccus sp. ZRK36 TaxID=2866311 RepID=UPI001C7347B6|nr:hypothetical protein [Ruficoccus sp. ZRK36]QYY35159.1 hypothetical protein K0V07_12740 [Ruficoccus sp. ZRK36]
MSILGGFEDLISWLNKLYLPIKLIFAPVIGFLTVVYALVSFGMSMLQKLLFWVDEEIAGLDLTVGSHHLNTVASDFWTTVNTFIPVDTIFALSMVIFALKFVMTIVRVVKSWIPTVSG